MRCAGMLLASDSSQGQAASVPTATVARRSRSRLCRAAGTMASRKILERVFSAFERDEALVVVGSLGDDTKQRDGVAHSYLGARKQAITAGDSSRGRGGLPRKVVDETIGPPVKGRERASVP